MRSHLARLVIVVVGALLLVPAAAQASGSILLSGTVYRWAGAAGTDTLTISGSSSVTFTSAGPTTISSTALGECTGAGTGTVTCDLFVQGGPITDVRALGNGGNDTITVNGGPPSVELELDGGPGNDTLRGSPRADVLRGGLDSDTVSYAGRADAITVTLDGVRGDGAPGENDDIAADVESVTGGSAGDTLTGNDAANTLVGGGGGDTLTGRGGLDSFRAGEGDDRVLARDGNAERVDCDAGADSADADADDELVACEPPADTGPAPPPVVDADGDGFPAAVDCDDGDRARNPGAVELPGNAVDEDCDGAAAELEPIGATIVSSFTTRGSRTRVNQLTVRNLPAGGRVLLTCSGRCPFARVSRRAERRRAALRLRPRFKDRRLRAGTVIRLRVTAPLTLGKALSFRMRDGRLPRKSSRCVRPGRTRTVSCPR